MKKVFAWVMALALVLFAAGACAETEETFFETLAGLEWSFSSGVGGWSTDMRIEADGSFSGDFHDSEMGESADEYPYGTVYCCSFTGRMALMEQVDEITRLIPQEGSVVIQHNNGPVNGNITTQNVGSAGMQNENMQKQIDSDGREKGRDADTE